VDVGRDRQRPGGFDSLVVVGMHKPCITVGRYVCDPGSDRFNLLVSKKVDLILSGHEHSYQRSKQLAHSAGWAAGSPGGYDAGCVADADSALTRARAASLASPVTAATASTTSPRAMPKSTTSPPLGREQQPDLGCNGRGRNR
jgi:hypothetical protein